MTETQEQPLVTFALFAYNQEQYVREAVEAALKQTYHPLEIILSDDKSSDGTFGIMKQLANEYSGQHRIVLNCNETNRGFSAHVNRVNDLAKGELVVVATGDDISVPHRVARLVKAWTEANKPAALSSQASVIDEAGVRISPRFMGYEGFLPNPSDDRQNCLRRLIRNDHCILLGCTEAWRKDLFEPFGYLGESIIHEDNAMAFRAWLVSGIHYVDEVLVDYRVHDQNIAHQKPHVFRSAKDFHLRESETSRLCKRRAFHLLQHCQDLMSGTDKNLIGQADSRDLANLLSLRIEENDAMACWWEVATPARAQIVWSAIWKGNARLLSWCGVRVAGIVVYSHTRAWLGLLSRTVRRFTR